MNRKRLVTYTATQFFSIPAVKIDVSSDCREHCDGQTSFLDLNLATPHARELEHGVQKSLSRSMSCEASYKYCSGVHFSLHGEINSNNSDRLNRNCDRFQFPAVFLKRWLEDLDC